MTRPTAQHEPREALIVGAGPAGIAAAIQLERSGIEPMLIERARPGGLLHNAHLVENYPGFPNGIPGPALVRVMLRHLGKTGVDIRAGTVLAIDRDTDGFFAAIEGRNDPIRARSIIVASGTRGIVPDDVPIPRALLGDYIYREVADLTPRLADTPSVSRSGASSVAILGGGDCAFDYALNLVGCGCRVTILHRGESPRALSLLVERLSRAGGAVYRPGVTVSGIERAGCGLRLRLRGRMRSSLEVAFLMLAVGREPEDEILSPGIRAALAAGETIDGLYIAGDVGRGLMRQVGIAVGDGLAAAMQIVRRGKGMKR